MPIPTQTLMDLLYVLDEANVPGDTLIDRLHRLVRDRDRLYAQVQKAAVRTDYQRLLESLDEDRSEALMMLADCCLDEGREAEARGWGWLALHKKWPARDREGWCWYGTTDLDGGNQGHLIPLPMWNVVGKPKHHDGPSGALLAVVNAFAEGRCQAEPERKESIRAAASGPTTADTADFTLDDLLVETGND